MSSMTYALCPQLPQAFRKMLEVLEPRYDPMSRKYLSETLLPKMYNQMIEQLKRELSTITYFALTHDIWSSLATESYGTVTCHYVSETWQLRSTVLATRKHEGSHTGESISEELNKIAVEWHLTVEGKSEPYIVTDNAANEVKAIKILGWRHISCMGHNFNLAVRAALALPKVSTVIARGRNQVTFFHSSPLATSMLLEKQKVLPEKARGHRLIQDVKTRWNSTYDMLEHLLEQTAALHAVAHDSELKTGDKLKRNLFDHTEQQIVESLVLLLKPMKTATSMLSADQSPTLSAIVPTLTKIEKLLEEQETDLTVIKNMKKVMADNLLLRNKGNIAIEATQKACILDPRMKDLRFLKQEERATITEHLVNEAHIIANEPHQPAPQVIAEPEMEHEERLQVKTEPGMYAVFL